MNFSRKSARFLAGPIAVTLVVLAGCSKVADKETSPQHAQTAPSSTATPAEADIPRLPDPSRTDPEAVAMRKKYFEWREAQEKLASDVGVQQAKKALGVGGK